jgi:hypothetical protein
MYVWKTNISANFVKVPGIKKNKTKKFGKVLINIKYQKSELSSP